MDYGIDYNYTYCMLYHDVIFKDDVKSVLRIFSAHYENNCLDPTVGILIKFKL